MFFILFHALSGIFGNKYTHSQQYGKRIWTIFSLKTFENVSEDFCHHLIVMQRFRCAKWGHARQAQPHFAFISVRFPYSWGNIITVMWLRLVSICLASAEMSSPVTL